MNPTATVDRNLALTVQYVGTRYRGWQSQPGGETIQDRLEATLGRILGERIRVHGAGRTDAGVHARGQVANFRTAGRLDPFRIRRAVNALLPPDIRVLDVREVPAGFHACRDARLKHYTYRFALGEVVSPFLEPFVHPLHGRIDLGRMAAGAARFLGEHDFSSFCTSAGGDRDRRRRVVRSEVAPENGEGIVAFRVAANGFLQHMVRSLAGTLAEVGRGRVEPEAIAGILAGRDRRLAGPCAPAKGLTLERVEYGGGE